MPKAKVALPPGAITRRRSSKAWGQAELANKAGISERTVTNADRGEEISVDTLSRLAEAFGCAPGDLLRASETEDARSPNGGGEPDVKGRLAELPHAKAEVVGPEAGTLEPIVSIGRLPRPGEYLLGREDELRQLDNLWEDPRTQIVSIIAVGGAGKSALVDAWLKHMGNDRYRAAERVLGWSFYSQGTRDGAASGDGFIVFALGWFGDPDPQKGSAWERGQRLAQFARRHRTLLVLDGLEPLQAPPGPDEGRIRDPGVQALVRELSAGIGQGLCVISSRIRVADLAAREDGAAPRIDLHHLSPETGAVLLELLGVRGSEEERKEATREAEGHALTLTLLGSYLADACDGDVRRRREIGQLVDDARHGGHAGHVMAAYEKWLGDGPETRVLRMLGLFDRPADKGSTTALRAPPAIPNLTDKIVEMGDMEWNQTLAKLRRAHLVSHAANTESCALDAHPLVRQYFGEHLQRHWPKSWSEGHQRLYRHLRLTTDRFPQTIPELAPLFQAVRHGCLGGQPREAFEDVYLCRIQRNSFDFLARLGASAEHVGVLSCFFDPPWERVVEGLGNEHYGLVMYSAGSVLRQVGRTEEAAKLMTVGLKAAEATHNNLNTSIAAANLASLYVAAGNLTKALSFAQQGVEYADRVSLKHESIRHHPMSIRTVLGNVLHQMGRKEEARKQFTDAERMQMNEDASFPLLYSRAGFRYCDFLLDIGEHANVLERARKMFDWRQSGDPLIDIAHEHLMLARALLLVSTRGDQATDFPEAENHFNEAVSGLRRAGEQTDLPHGLLCRADFYLRVGDLAQAYSDLEESFALATWYGMRLFEADAQLGFVRVHRARADIPAARKSLAAARELVGSCGYHRRDIEIAELEQLLAERS